MSLITNIFILYSLACINHKVNEISESAGDAHWKNIKLDIHLYINKELVSLTKVVVNNKNVKERIGNNVNSKDTRRTENVTIKSDIVKSYNRGKHHDLNRMFSLPDNRLRSMLISYDENTGDENYGGIVLDWEDSNLNKYKETRNATISRIMGNDKNITIHMSISIKSDNDSGNKNNNINPTYLEYAQKNITNKTQVVLLQSVEKSCHSNLVINFSLDKLLIDLLPHNSSLTILTSPKTEPNQITLSRSNRTTCRHCVLLCWIAEHWLLIISFGPVLIILLYKKYKIFSNFLNWLLHIVSACVELWGNIEVLNKQLCDLEKDVKESCDSLCISAEKHFQKTQEIYEHMQNEGCSCQKNIAKLEVGIDKLRFSLKNLKEEFLHDKKRTLYYLKSSSILFRYMRMHLSECEEKWKEQMKNNTKRMPGEQIIQRGQGEMTGVICQTPQFVRNHYQTKRFSKREVQFVTKHDDKQKKRRNVLRKCKRSLIKRSKSLEFQVPLKRFGNNSSAQKINSESSLLESKKELMEKDFTSGRIERQLTFDNFSLQANPLFKKQKSQHLENSNI